MSRLVLALTLLALSGCATLTQFTDRLTAIRDQGPSGECGEPAADAGSHNDVGESSGGDSGQP